MHKVFFSALIAGVLFAQPVISSAGIYQYRDQNGNVVYSDSPPAGTEARERQFQEQRFDGSRLSPSGGKGGQKPKKEDHRKNGRSAGDVSVILYSTSWCGYCTQARSYLRSLGVRLVEYDIEADAKRAAEMRQKSGGSKGVPLIDVEGIILRGFSEESIDDAIERKKAEN
ncbi:MAG: glutaredoxin domain-containing protein [Thermodesulfovibrionales bacterium]